MTEPSQGFVDSYTSGVPAAQRKVIEALLEEKRRQGFIVVKSQRDKELNLSLEKIRTLGKFFQYEDVAPLQTITADFFNDNFDDVLLDLKTLYRQLGLINANRARITAVTNDSFIKTKAAINALVNQLKLFRFLKNAPEYQDAKFIDFNEAANRTNVRPAAAVDVKTRNLKLPISRQSRHSAARFSLDRAVPTVSFLGGGITGTDNAEFTLDNALDTNPDTFWAEIILAEAIPKHKVLLTHNSTRRKIGSGEQVGRTFSSRGAVAHFDIKFHRTIRMNNFRVLPISEYPVRVLDIAFKTSELDNEWVTLPNFDPANYEETLDWIEWNGPRTHMGNLRLTLEQQNYTTNIYQIPSDLVANNQLWGQILDKTFNELIHNVALDEVLADKIAADPSQLAALNEFEDLSRGIGKISLSGRKTKAYEIVERIQAIATAQLTRITPIDGAEFVNSVDGLPLVSTAPLTEVRKLQFMLGIRVLEVNDFQYVPFAAYESQKFESNANILEVSVLTKEQHKTVPDAVLSKPFQKTNIEYELELGKNTRVPIARADDIVTTDLDQQVEITDELLIVNRRTFKSIVRFYASDTEPGVIPAVQVRKNGNRLSPLVLNSGGGGTAPSKNYTASFVEIESKKYVQIEFNGDTFDRRAVYTCSYVAHIDAAVVDINARFDSEVTLEPEEFKGTDRDQRVVLNFYPYIEYSIVNDTNIWSPRDDEQIWDFVPAVDNYIRGKININSGNTYLITGVGTSWEELPAGDNSDTIRDMVTGPGLFGLTGASIQIVGDSQIYAISGVVSNSGIHLKTPVDLGFLPSGIAPTGLPYVIGRTQDLDGQIFGLNNNVYEPIKVYVNDIKATNKTNYETLEHEAFLPQDQNTRIFEYLQIGKFVYFNGTVDAKIEVDYRYLTEYLKLNALLRSHKVVQPTETPILENYTLRIRNSKI
jgi:hypothetical protein